MIYYNPESSGHLVFRGIDGVECEEFIWMIRLRALAAGKSRDKEHIGSIRCPLISAGSLEQFTGWSFGMYIRGSPCVAAKIDFPR